MAKSSRTRSSGKVQSIRRVRELPKLAQRYRGAHKGEFGRVLVLGGSRGMIGAPTLAATAALRGGAGLVTVACPVSVQVAIASLCPCATSIPLPESARGTVDPRRAAKTLDALGVFKIETTPSVVAAGPGLGRGSQAFDRAWHSLLGAFGRARVPVVLDADGLNALHRSSKDWRGPAWDTTAHFQTVITPHPGEMARLLGTTTAVVQRDREGIALTTARKMSAIRGRGPDFRAVVVLKGAETVVTDGERLYTNKTGNPGMATGGSGDVLTGLIAAFIGQGLACFEAAVLGVHIHGLAGDFAARDAGEVSVIATDIVDYLPDALLANWSGSGISG